ncbi:hypothetical protein [Defluviimonas salinarum]|uniref:Uncharacterized protein n=1 Tax=Defluviimonas salinarum TaxID=2992147 RepID=A0ABT3J089_9RHOB|nr:hypothetical protein [Defluviimonas salinarum]MCW3781085.1 hypothetical protein [Defluviimonas salinarum]
MGAARHNEQAEIGAGAIRALLVDLPQDLAASLPGLGRLSTVSIGSETFDLRALAQVMPDVVITPLIGPGIDILDLARRLAAFGYGGALRAVTGPIPCPAEVTAEVRGACVGIDFDLLVVAEPARI